jgi:hypothetical protein
MLNDANINNDEDKMTIHKLLPIVLKDLGLEKKRYSTGIFWYGLVLQNTDNNIFNNDFIKKVSSDPNKEGNSLTEKMEALMNKREEDAKVFNTLFLKPTDGFENLTCENNN